MTRRHLITGAQGLIGRHLAAQVLASDPAAMVLGLGRSPRKDRLAFTMLLSPLMGS